LIHGEPALWLNQKNNNNDNDAASAAAFECNICFDTAVEPVITLCGHLYCWPCIYKWLDSGRSNITCPVCHSELSKEKLVPLYGKGKCEKDPRQELPPRPSGVRTEPPQNQYYNNNGHFYQGNNWSFSAGVLPFPGFGFQIYNHQFNNNTPRNLTPIERRNEKIGQIFSFIAFMILFSVVFQS